MGARADFQQETSQTLLSHTLEKGYEWRALCPWHSLRAQESDGWVLKNACACKDSQVWDLAGIFMAPILEIWGWDSSTLGYIIQLSSERARTSSRIQMFSQKKKKKGKEKWAQIHIFMSASLVYRRKEQQSGGWKVELLSKHPRWQVPSPKPQGQGGPPDLWQRHIPSVSGN